MKRAIIIFTRIPVKGMTKTRLMPFLSGEECASLHACFIKDIYMTCQTCEGDIIICHTTEGKKEILEGCCKEPQLFFPQQGADLGARMKAAFAYVFDRGYEACVLIGTDIPQLEAPILEQAFQDLLVHDIVINPTTDGGYYLIGMTAQQDAIWNVKHYGTHTVMEDTLYHMRANNLKVKLGAECCDIDTKEELCQLYTQLQHASNAVCTNTWEYMDKSLCKKWNGKKELIDG